MTVFKNSLQNSWEIEKSALTSSYKLCVSHYWYLLPLNRCTLNTEALMLTEGLFIQVVNDSPSQFWYLDLTDLCHLGLAVTLKWRDVRWLYSWGFYILPSLQAHGVPPTPVINPLPSKCAEHSGFSFLYTVSNAVMLTTYLQAEFIRLPHSLGRILIDHWIYIIAPPASNIPQSFWMLKGLWFLQRTLPSPILAFQTAKPGISFPANRHSETSKMDIRSAFP